MSIQKIVIDKEDYSWVPGGAYTLSGWKAIDTNKNQNVNINDNSKNGKYAIDSANDSSGQSAIFEVLDEQDSPVKADILVQPRPDVVRKYPKYADQAATLGFQVTVHDLECFISEHQKLTIRLSAGRDSHILYSRTTGELRKAYQDTSIRYFLDVCSCTDDTITLQGWIVDITGECFPTITDENGTLLPVQPTKTLRRDLVGALGLDRDFYQDHSWGFTFSIPRSDFHGSALVLHMENPYTTKTLKLPIRRLAFLSSKAGRLPALLTRQTPRKLLSELRSYGLKGFLARAKSANAVNDMRYETWLAEHRPSKKELNTQRKTHFAYEPLLSFVIPLYNTPPQYLKELLDSILTQTYQNFEVCLADGSTTPGTNSQTTVQTNPSARVNADTKAVSADRGNGLPQSPVSDFIRKNYGSDPRIRLKRLSENRGISENTNEAIRMAKGEFLVFSDHDDFLEPNALFELVSRLNEQRDLDIIYTDEDLTDEASGHFSDPRFKPDFNPDFLRCINYICHLTMVRTDLALEVGLLRRQCDGAQDHDFLLRCIEKTDRVGHIPKVLYHWRAYSGSTAGNQDSKQYAIDAGKLALIEHYARLGWDAQVEYADVFIIYKAMLAVKGSPLVTILIPNKDMVDTLDTCVQSIFAKTDYPYYEILIVENNSEEPATFAYYEKMQREHENFRVVTYEGGFNYSAINNLGVRHARGEYILFLNNDTEVISPHWIREMLGYCQRKNTAAVGAKLYYPDDQIQHAGVVIGIGNFAGHVLAGSPRYADGYFGRLRAVQDISAVTAACMLVKRSVFESIGGFDEDFVVSLNDVDLCLRMREKGFLIVMDPNVELYHYESKSRGYETTPEKQERFKKEILRFRERWATLLEAGDPYYSPNLTIMDGSCGIRHKDEVPEIWKQLFGEGK